MKARFKGSALAELIQVMHKYIDPEKEYILDLCQKRTLSQNAYYNAVVIPTYSKLTGYCRKDAHIHLTTRFLTTNGKTRSTADITSIEFEDYLNDCRLFIYHTFGVSIPAPQKVSDEIMVELENVYKF